MMSVAFTVYSSHRRDANTRHAAFQLCVSSFAFYTRNTQTQTHTEEDRATYETYILN